MANRTPQIVHLGIEKLWQTTRGAGVRVAVLDTGVWTSPALPKKRVETTAFDGGEQAPTADAHGTSCASLIASEAKDATGIAPEARILSVQLSTSADMLTEARVVSGLALALERGCHVVSCSFTLASLTGARGDLGELVREAHLSGIPVIAAHGNTADNRADFPERVQHAIVVSAHTASDRPQRVNHNQWTDLFSLGEGLAVVGGAGNTRTWTGKTSGATALVAGAVALALAAVPPSKRARVGVAMEGLLKSTASSLGTRAGGRRLLQLNARRLLEAAQSL